MQVLKTDNFQRWYDKIRSRDGIRELRIHYGPGYRVYYTVHQDAIIVILIGGNKTSQKRDIKRACDLWKDIRKEQSW